MENESTKKEGLNALSDDRLKALYDATGLLCEHFAKAPRPMYSNLPAELKAFRDRLGHERYTRQEAEEETI